MGLFEGTNGADILVGTDDADTIDGERGNDTLTGGGGADRFRFYPDWGHDVITDFNPLEDVLDLDRTTLTLAEKLNAFQQVGDDVVFDAGDGNSITLADVSLEDMDLGINVRIPPAGDAVDLTSSATSTVNGTTGGAEGDAQIQPLVNGSYVFSWIEGTGNAATVHSRIYDAEGQAVTNAFTSSAGTGGAGDFQLMSLESGGFVLAWTEGSGVSKTLYHATYDEEGERVSAPDATLDVSQFGLISLNGGGYLMIGETDEFMAAVFDANGNQLTPFQPSGLEGDITIQGEPGFHLANNTIVLYGDSVGSGVTTIHLNGSSLDLTFGPSNFETPTSIADRPLGGAELADGGYAIAWGETLETSQIGDDYITVQMLFSSGQKSANPIVIGDARRPDIAALAEGGMIVVWVAPDGHIHGQQFDAEGKAVTDVAQLTYDTPVYGTPDIAQLEDGSLRLTYVNARGDVQVTNVFTDFEEHAADVANLVVDDGGDIQLVALSGKDTVYGGGGDDTVVGGQGNDVLRGEADNDLLAGDAGADRLVGGDGDDNLFGGPGGDVLVGGDGEDTLYGGAGADILNGGAGLDTIFGGEGNDQIWAGDGDLRRDHMYGGDGDDTIGGGDGWDYLVGGVGSDAIFGGEGNDTLWGMAPGETETASNSLWGGIGKDLIYGSEGHDIIGGANGDDTIEAGGGNDSIYGGFGGDDSLLGGAGQDIAYAGNGHDTLIGGDGGDELYGGNGNDIVYGEGGDDTLYGSAQDDTLVGGAGNDILRGGKGADVFLFEVGSDEDQIDGFSIEEDFLDLSGTQTPFLGVISLEANATTVDGGVMIDLGGGDSVVILDITLDQVSDINLIL